MNETPFDVFQNLSEIFESDFFEKKLQKDLVGMKKPFIFVSDNKT
jgi:hypothetical protein